MQSSSPSGGRRRAVTIGLNYIGLKCQLSGCINDSDTFISLLTEAPGKLRCNQNQAPREARRQTSCAYNNSSASMPVLHNYLITVLAQEGVA